MKLLKIFRIQDCVLFEIRKNFHYNKRLRQNSVGTIFLRNMAEKAEYMELNDGEIGVQNSRDLI